jgi:hypothetical protein
MLRNKSNLEDVIFDVFCCQPKLLPSVTAEGAQFRGHFVLQGPSAPICEIPLVIEYDVRFPEIEPVVQLVEPTFPFKIDRHIYTNGTCCVCIWEHWLSTSKDITMSGFLKGPVSDFFLSQLYFNEHGSWPFGEWEHGEEGLLQAYSAILNVEPSRSAVLESLNRIVRRDRSRGRVLPSVAEMMRQRVQASVNSQFESIRNQLNALENEEAVKYLVRDALENDLTMVPSLAISTAIKATGKMKVPDTLEDVLFGELRRRLR